MTDLITSRLVLHPLSVAEATRIVGGTAGPDDTWADGFPGDGDRDAARMAVKAAGPAGVCLPASAAFTCYRIDCRRDHTAIGTIGFHGPPDKHHQATIGYGLVPHSWGNGYATEALHALVELCRTHSAVSSLAADTNHDNHASQRVLTKSGFRLVRQDRELFYYELGLD
ncbi:MAG: GNAT family N-acetyltransferase [Actinocrinis sp.]